MGAKLMGKGFRLFLARILIQSLRRDSHRAKNGQGVIRLGEDQSEEGEGEEDLREGIGEDRLREGIGESLLLADSLMEGVPGPPMHADPDRPMLTDLDHHMHADLHHQSIAEEGDLQAHHPADRIHLTAAAVEAEEDEAGATRAEVTPVEAIQAEVEVEVQAPKEALAEAVVKGAGVDKPCGLHTRMEEKSYYNGLIYFKILSRPLSFLSVSSPLSLVIFLMWVL